jgi:hypothetical protein
MYRFYEIGTKSFGGLHPRGKQHMGRGHHDPLPGTQPKATFPVSSTHYLLSFSTSHIFTSLSSVYLSVYVCICVIFECHRTHRRLFKAFFDERLQIPGDELYSVHSPTPYFLNTLLLPFLSFVKFPTRSVPNAAACSVVSKSSAERPTAATRSVRPLFLPMSFPMSPSSLCPLLPSQHTICALSSPSHSSCSAEAFCSGRRII